MGTAGFGGSFAPIVQYKNGNAHRNILLPIVCNYSGEPLEGVQRVDFLQQPDCGFELDI